MHARHLLHHLVSAPAVHAPERIALVSGSQHISYGALQTSIDGFASGLAALGLARAERVAIYLDKRPEFVAAAFGCSAAGGVFVPVNPILKADQVGHILHDCTVRVLVTTPERFGALRATLAACHDLRHVVLVGRPAERPQLDGLSLHLWDELVAAPSMAGHRVIDTDMAAILYTSGSTGRPKGVVLAHRNMMAGARSVASYLGNHADDTLLAALPLSFDAGLSQLTTAFHAGARVVLLNYLMPRDVLKAVERERVTGLTAVPPLWIQLAQLEWPAGVSEHLRYFANTGGRMPLDTLTRLRAQLPASSPFLMYGLTEAFRATYLPPEEIDRRPDSIGKAIPDTEVLVLREDGSECAPNEPGELVQRGALVAMGYWNDPERTAERFRPLPPRAPGREPGLVLPEIAVFSGDTVRRDEDGFLYFIGRRDEMIKTSGYRVSPTEIEEILYATGMVGECVAFGQPHPTLGQGIAVIATPLPGTTLDTAALLAECRARMPAYMVPTRIELRSGPLPRNPNGKLDRKALSAD
ncbi:acyl-CoA ligase (AMP-forming), exosortase A system-associated [Thauera sp. WB-2]|uniref:acyl-CoA ligase (AMP-forming), exosortase A system-associated n=1 Tax=Thauera sp. WB-2 TaxID=2897772 RepID=UPI0022DDF5D3|nr:acyl-CoA ligase (AMP-forming), exosortase A system-associated [Thauera sp. WB-2]WBL65248.1 acyl-CoA ligase (AMP-forming), exosortase A system-associated [Thauera sp. WB-2]HRK11082.1 acyl-CoA ligase (AMP-forming), exosortase A system-associated [Thauera sp.]